ncbi:MAG: hypothetical protein M3Y27_22730 [Acidobacteriota bacterium]|nr:hypothetical protein [Acidobacteriota bacterium]
MRKLLALSLLSIAAFAADISGTWKANVETDAGSGTPTFVFKQSGDNLTGTYSGQLGEAKLTGTVQGNKVEWSFDAQAGDDKARISYHGTLDGETKMKGTVEYASLGKGTFSAVKQ